MPGPPSEPPIGLQLARVARDVTAALDAELVAAGGDLVTWQVLVLLQAQRGGAQKDLAAAMGIREATMTHHLKRLEREGLVERTRDPDNRRVQRVTLTPKGRRRFAALRETAVRFDGRLRDALSAEERAAFGAALVRLQTAAGGPRAS